MPRHRGGELNRRAFSKAALAIGGMQALSACISRGDGREIPMGVADPGDLPTGQHQWDESLIRDEWDNIIAPRHHLFLLLDYMGEGTPTDAERDELKAALRSLERGYEWSNEGLVFTLGYTPAYFDRFDAELDDSVELPEPEPLAPFEDPERDLPDAGLHLASDHVEVLLQAEESLFGETEPDHAEMQGTLEGIFQRPEPGDTVRRRTGFVGAGLPAEHTDARGIPDDAPIDDESPLFMNFESAFRKNQASEERVTIESGPFAGGTTQHLSKLHLNLHQWYGQDTREDRESLMFCPVHAKEGRIEGTGRNLGDNSAMDEACTDHVTEHAERFGQVGHSQKMAAEARQDDEPLILRRDFDTTDDGHAGLHFLSVQKSIKDFVITREAMNGTDIANETGIGVRTNNGILQYINVQRRGNYLLPPREHRAFPEPMP